MTAPSADGRIAGRRIADRSWFDRPAAPLARALLGCRIVVAHDDATVGGSIVETEAYAGPEDLAAHSARGLTARTATMFGAPGHLYVYLIYGIHHCINVVAGPGEKPEAVLIRALALDEGIGLARARRGDAVPDTRLASGPGNVARALGIGRGDDGTDLVGGRIAIEDRGRAPKVMRGPRVGVDYAGRWAARPLRFWIADDPHVSRR